MSPAEPSAYREVPAKCRKAALSSADPEQWVLLAELREWLANTPDGTCLLAKAIFQFEAEASPASGDSPRAAAIARVAMHSERDPVRRSGHALEAIAPEAAHGAV
jgi:hypothetical protein